MAMSYEAVKDTPIVKKYDDGTGNIVVKETFDLEAFIVDFSKRIDENFEDVKWVESSPRFLAGMSFVCFMGIAYYLTTRKNFITNMEFGTSRWGTAKELKHLLAKNLRKEEIKRIKRGGK